MLERDFEPAIGEITGAVHDSRGGEVVEDTWDDVSSRPERLARANASSSLADGAGPSRKHSAVPTVVRESTSISSSANCRATRTARESPLDRPFEVVLIQAVGGHRAVGTAVLDARWERLDQLDRLMRSGLCLDHQPRAGQLGHEETERPGFSAHVAGRPVQVDRPLQRLDRCELVVGVVVRVGLLFEQLGLFVRWEGVRPAERTAVVGGGLAVGSDRCACAAAAGAKRRTAAASPAATA